MRKAAQRKQALRRRLRELRIAEPGPRSLAAQERLLGLPELGRASTAALYAPLTPEPLTDRLVAALGDRRLCYPAVERGRLVFRTSAARDLIPGPYPELLQPDPAQPEVTTGEIDVFVVPGLAFDRYGHRLGRGQGLYDRVLVNASPTAFFIGLCYADCFIEELPSDRWDIPMHVIVTDRALHRVLR